MSTPSLAEHFRFYNRIKKPVEYAAVFSSKNRTSDKFFLFLVIKNNTNIARLGLAVPKKNVSSAVERNRIKRIIRESFRSQKNRLKGKDVVVFVKKQFDTKGGDIKQALISHWEKIINE